MRTLTISKEFKVWYVGDRATGVSGGSLERALGKALPYAPDEWLHHAAKVIESLMSKEPEE